MENGKFHGRDCSRRGSLKYSDIVSPSLGCKVYPGTVYIRNYPKLYREQVVKSAKKRTN